MPTSVHKKPETLKCDDAKDKSVQNVVQNLFIEQKIHMTLLYTYKADNLKPTKSEVTTICACF